MRQPSIAKATPAKAEVLNSILRTRLAAFTRKTFTTVDPGAAYQHNWHIDLIAEYLEACTRGEIKRLIINMPPRYMKSISVSVAWPAWLLGRNPSEQIMVASFADNLAIKLSTDCRLVLQSPWYRDIFPGTIITGDQNEKRKFVTTQRGYRIATTVGSSVIGEGGNILIVDDPVNAMQALSETEREHANTWFDQAYTSRLNDKKNGVMVLVMQRLHQNDLTGHLLEKGGWEHLVIPKVAEKRTIIDFGRVKRVIEPGDVLHPARQSADDIEREKQAMGSYAFAAQCQQRPTPAEGGIFKREWFLERYDTRREVYRSITQSWDTAHKASEINDPSVCTTWGETESGYHLLHVLVQRMEYPELKRVAINHAEAWAVDALLIEDKASGQSLIQDLRRESKLPVIAIQPQGDKVTRASVVSPTVEAGKVILPKQAQWLSDFEDEIFSFPNAAHDDQVDSVSQFLAWAKNKADAQPQNYIRRL
jgi:predicted phage terminase large subunit-like protein